MFFAHNSVFSVEDFDRFLAEHGTGNRWTRKSLLAYHIKQGHLLRLRRGLFASVPEQVDPDSFQPNPFHVAAKITADATLAYHTALMYHGLARAESDTFYSLSRGRTLPFRFRSSEYRCVPIPKKLLAEGQEGLGIQQFELAEEGYFSDMVIRYTGLERTLVDVLD
ncbi:MAG: transcriptional regulator, partial [Deltaproteobacteria bacterium]|nr:transcriptional regulator [Deltaproteobacteria bacterium]